MTTYRPANMALIAQAAKNPIQIGENFPGLPPMAGPPDGWSVGLRHALTLNRSVGHRPLASAGGARPAYNASPAQSFTKVSAHLLAATPGRHWLETSIGRSICKSRGSQGRHGRIPSAPSWLVREQHEVVIAKYRLD